MLRETATLLTLCCCLAWGEGAHPALGAGSLSVYLANPSAIPASVREVMDGELRDLLQSSGFVLNWYDGSGSVPGRMAVIRLQGSCDLQAKNPLPPRQTFRDPESLASTHVSNGEVLPFADVRCDHLRRFIATPLLGVNSSATRDEMLGRALARVIAHELYHIVLRTREHGTKGLARAAQNARQLVSPGLNFSAEDERRMSNAKSGANGITPATPSDDSAPVTDRQND